MPPTTQTTPVVPADHRLPDHDHVQAHPPGGGHGGGGGGGGHDPHDEGAIPTDLPMPGTGTIVLVVVAFAVALAVLTVVGEVPHYREQRATREDAKKRSEAKPVVQWSTPIAFPGDRDVTLPCDVQANQQTAIYTRTNGYLKRWNYDIGQHVNQGDLMAVIETPEVDAQLAQSKANVEQAEANVTKSQASLDLAKSTLQRYLDAQRDNPGSVTREDVDTQQSNYENAAAALKQTEASVTQAKAAVQQEQVTVDFEKVYAPFSGTVTARNYDNGALLSPTETGAGKEIFDLAQTDLLRVFVNVPQVYANNITMDQPATLYVRNFPTVPFTGRVTYTAGAIDPNTRTLRVQIDFDNKDGRLFAGGYGQVHLPVTPKKGVMVVKTSSLIFNSEQQHVAVLDAQNKVHFKTIEVGRDFGTDIEVTGGLDPADHVVDNPGERIDDGSEVTAHQAPPEPQPATKPAPATRFVDAPDGMMPPVRPTTRPAMAAPTTEPAAEPTTRPAA